MDLAMKNCENFGACHWCSINWNFGSHGYKKKKQESVFDKHKCPRKHKIIKQMFFVFAYFSRKQKQNCKDNSSMSSYEAEMILTVLVILNWCEFSVLL